MKRQMLPIAIMIALAWNGTAVAQDAKDTRVLLSLLREQLEIKDFLAPMNFKEAVELLMQTFAGKGKDLRIIVDAQAFENCDGTLIYNAPVQFQPYPKKLSARAYLEYAISGVQPCPASYTIRRGAVFISTARQVAFAQLRKEIVRGAYASVSFAEVLEDLADQVGADVTIDKRVTEKANKLVTISFRNSTLEDAVALLADQADLRAVALPSGFYVTSRENAERLERDLDRQKKEPAKKK